jgi:hypothetical protein
MTTREQLLYRIMQCPGTINNHYSREAKTADGALLQPAKYFKSFEKQGLIRKAIYDFEPTNKRREITYFLTHKGAKAIGMDQEYKYKELRASSTVKHDSMVKDLALSFLYLYPEWEFEFEYEPTIHGHKPDMFVNMRREGGLHYKFWVEIERKKECYKGVMHKVAIFDKIKGKLPKNTKCLFALLTLYHDPLLRPREYDKDIAVKSRIEDNNKQFNRFVKSVKLSNDYLFLNFLNFYRLNEAVWYGNSGSPRKLIQ